MRNRVRPILSWAAGLLCLVILLRHFQVADFFSQVARVGVGGVAGWLACTLSARALLVTVTVSSVKVIGYSLRWSDAFWIGWIRTFANQVVPLSGLALFARAIRRKAGIPWSGILALSSPTLLYATCALCLIGLVAVIGNAEYLHSSAAPMLAAFLLVGGGSLIAMLNAAWVFDHLPRISYVFAEQSAAAFRLLSENVWLVLRLMSLNVLAILIRGVRIWLLFSAVGVDIPLLNMLLLVVIAESTALFQITPGGLGLREGAIVGGAALLQISPELATIVALIDRLFMVATTVLLAVPGFFLLRTTGNRV